MDYVSGTSDAALNSSSPAHVSSHQIQRQKESFSLSIQQLGLKKQILCHPSAQRPSWPGQGLVGTLTGVTPLLSMARSCSIDITGAAPGPQLELSPPQLNFQLQQPLRWLLRVLGVAGGCDCPGASPSCPASSQPLSQAHFWN